MKTYKLISKNLIIPLLLVSFTVMSGCSWPPELAWPWKKKKIPVTKAKWVSKEQWPETQPAAITVPQETPKAVKVTPSPTPTKPQEVKPAKEAPQDEFIVETEIKPLGPAKTVTAGVLRVKDKFITLDDLISSADERLLDLSKNATPTQFKRLAPQILGQELARKINDELILNEANARMSEGQKGYVESEVEKYRQKLLAGAGGSIKKLQDELAAEGTTLEDELETKRRASTVQIYLRMKFLPAVTVNRKMLMDYYIAHREEFTTPKKVQMQLIAAPLTAFLPKGMAGVPSEAEKEVASKAAKKVIEQAKAQLSSGKDFSAVAREFSKGPMASSGGLWPMMPKGSFREKPVEDRAYQMTAGQVSDIIETDNGFYIVKVSKVQEGKTTTFEESQDKASALLRQQQFDKLINDFYKRLQKSAERYFDPEFVKQAAERAQEIYLN